MYYIDSINIEGKYYNLKYAGGGTYQVLEGSRPTDIRFSASTQAEAISKFQAIMNSYR